MIKLAFVGFSILLAGSATAWEPSRPYEQLPDSEIETKIRALEIDAISEAGARKSTSSISALEFVLGVQDWNAADEAKYGTNKHMKEQSAAHRGLARHLAKLALAKIGERKYLREYIADLSSSNDMKAAGAISSLASIRDRRTVKYLIPFLDKDFVPKFTPGKRGPSAFSELAEQALESILPDVLAEFRKQHPGRRFYFKKEWKTWWAANKDKFQEGID